ncbi:MAG: ubiquinone biosynthesis protein [Halopseudomonas sp.]|jgi:ubiquinone biosynthesis protein
MRERAMPQHQLRNWQQQLEQVPPLLHSTRQALDRLAMQPVQPVVTRSSNTGLRLAGLLLGLLGASGLGAEPALWTQAEPTQWLLIVVGGWLVLRRGMPRDE